MNLSLVEKSRRALFRSATMLAGASVVARAADA